MKVKIYRYKESCKELVTARGIVHVPESVKRKFGGLEFFQEVDLKMSDLSRVGYDSKTAIADIKRQGSYISAGI